MIGSAFPGVPMKSKLSFREIPREPCGFAWLILAAGVAFLGASESSVEQGTGEEPERERVSRCHVNPAPSASGGG